MDPKPHFGRAHYKATNVLQHIECMKTRKPSMYAREITDKLLDIGVCDVNCVPSRQTISHRLIFYLRLQVMVTEHILQYSRWRI